MSVRVGPRGNSGGIFAGLVIGIVFGLGGIIAVFFGSRTVLRAIESENWPSTTGEVNYSEVDIHSDSDGTSYSPDVRYFYFVEGKQYQSERVYFGSDVSSSNRRRHQETVDRYPVGSRVTVYYDPDNPATGVLEPGATFDSAFLVIFGGCFGLSGLGSLGVSGLSILRRR